MLLKYFSIVRYWKGAEVDVIVVEGMYNGNHIMRGVSTTQLNLEIMLD